MPSMVGGRLTRFCFPLMNIDKYLHLTILFWAFSAGVSFRFCLVYFLSFNYLRNGSADPQRQHMPLTRGLVYKVTSCVESVK